MYLSSLSVVHQTFVTYSFVRNSQTTTTHPNPLPGHSVATPDMAASPAHTLLMRKHHTFTNTGETRQIKHYITCDSTNLTYMIQS